MARRATSAEREGAPLVDLPSGLLVNGEWRTSDRPIPVMDKYRHEVIAELHGARASDVADAVGAADATYRAKPVPPYQRAEMLRKAAALLQERSDVVTSIYVAETGFTRKDAAVELARARDTLLLSAEEATRLTGETVPVEGTPGSENRVAFTLRVPVGVVCAIAPFNAPLNTVVHKVAPALAAGNAVVLKPATATPLCSVVLCQALLDAGWPAGYVNMLVGPGDEVGARLLSDKRIRYYTFTGSTRVGLRVKQQSGIAKTHLELGSSAATIVCADADLDLASRLIVRGGFRKAGQVCTSVQRVLVHASVAEALADHLVAGIGELHVGDPNDPATDVGPMISTQEAERAVGWVEQAMTAGAHLLAGGHSAGALMEPTLLIDAPLSASLMCDEAFAPIVALYRFGSLDEAVKIANGTEYGLQAGVFTRNLDLAFDLARRLEVGGVMINDTSSYHADAMPYGGVKASGYGSEGPAYAVRDMTDPRIVVLNLQKPSA